jgi:hypothetical protein
VQRPVSSAVAILVHVLGFITMKATESDAVAIAGGFIDTADQAQQSCQNRH